MRKKLFTLMTLLVGAVSSSWAEYRQILLYDASVNNSITTTPIGDYVTLTEVSQGTGDGKYGIKFTSEISEDKYIYVTLPSSITFAENDKIIITEYQSGTGNPNKDSGTTPYGACISATTSTTVADAYKFNIPTASAKNPYVATYTVNSTDDFIGQTSFYVRAYSPNSNKSSFIQKIEVQQYYVDSRHELTLSFTPNNQTIQPEGTLVTSLSWTEDTSSESAKYSTTYTSSNDAVATVDETGKVTAVAVGDATITAIVAATSDATYKTTSTSINVSVRTSLSLFTNTATPTTVLDLTDANSASTMLNGTWHSSYGRALFGNDGANNYLTFAVVGADQSTATQTWMGKYGTPGSSSGSWDAVDNFKGSSAYNMPTSRFSNITSSQILSFRVKGSSKVQALADSRSSSKYIVLAAFEVTSGTPASTTLTYDQQITNNSSKTLSVNLDDSKEYIIVITTDNTSNTRWYEMALFYDEAVTLYEPISAASGKTYATYVTKNAVDFSAVSSEITAYTAESVSASSVTLTQKDNAPAGTPLLVKMASAGGSANVPYAASTDAVGTNLLVAGAGTAVKSDGTNYVYVLQSGKFMLVEESYPTPPTVPVGKAYLSTTTVTAPVLDIDSEVTTAIQSEETTQKGLLDGDFYNIAGQRVSHPTKGLYIVNGKKVIVK